MPCNLTKGKDLTCRDTTGGVKNMYFTDYDATLNTTVTRSATGAITDYPAITFYKYVMPRGTSGFDQTINTSLENGTTFYEGTLTSILNGLTQEDLNELQLLVVGTPHVVIETQSGAFYQVAIQNGLVAGGTAGTGIALGDRVGAALAFVSQEPELAPTVTDFLSITNVTIVSAV